MNAIERARGLLLEIIRDILAETRPSSLERAVNVFAGRSRLVH